MCYNNNYRKRVRIMKKHTYSIVLTDTVVQEVDRLAAQKGTNRSTMMNQILADYFSCKTPEKQMASVFSLIEQQMQNVFRVQLQASDAMISLHSALQYKYRPTVRYRVELLRIPTENSIGWLKISCRTQNQALLHSMQEIDRMCDALALGIANLPSLSDRSGVVRFNREWNGTAVASAQSRNGRRSCRCDQFLYSSV